MTKNLFKMLIHRELKTLLERNRLATVVTGQDKTQGEVISRLNDIYNINAEAQTDADLSFAGEYHLLNLLTDKLKITNGFVIDIAANDGCTQSCTLGFFRRDGWSGLAVEMNPINFSKLAFIYAVFPNAKLARCRVTPKNIKPLLDSYEVPRDISVLNLDIDSYDLYVIEEILKANYKPRLISMEINEKIPAGIFFTVEFNDEHYWQNDHFFGCSIDAACSVVKPFGYILYKMEYNNAIFIRNDIILNSCADLTPSDAYNLGYKSRPNRKELFPWNADVEHWLHSSVDDCIVLIREYFKKYNGKFKLSKI